MNTIRYMITRSCLQDGAMRLARYNEHYFPQSGPVQFVDDAGVEHHVQVDRQRMQVTGLAPLYHDHNLGANDVLMITQIAPSRYQVEAIVKPHPAQPAPRSAGTPQPAEAKRVVVSSTPHVREVRTQPAEQGSSPAASSSAEKTETMAEAMPTQTLRDIAALFGEQKRSAVAAQIPAATPAEPMPAARTIAPVQVPGALSEQLSEFARLTGYQLSYPGSGLVRLSAELGPQYGYRVLLACDPLAMTHPVWEEGQDDVLALVTTEADDKSEVGRVTQEALVALIEQAQVAPLTPLDLQGYWKSGNLDLAATANIAELLGAHLAQRGAFSYVMQTLAQQTAPSIVSTARLAERLGSGVNTAELNSILETLSRSPFLALTPLPGGQYLLKADVSDILSDLADYAQGVRRHLKTPTSTATTAIPAVTANKAAAPVAAKAEAIKA